MLVLAWILAAIALYLLVSAPRPAAVGVFVLPVVLALLVVAGLMPPAVAGGVDEPRGLAERLGDRPRHRC